MAAIYSNASVMLGATGSSDGSGGLFTSRSPPVYEKFHYERDGNAGIMQLFPVPRHIAVTASSAPFLENEPLSQRGWALQERWLSPRVIHFGSQQMFFECHGHIVAEDGFRAEGRIDSAHEDSLPASLRNNVVNASRGSTLWIGIVSAYCRRALTKGSDKLPALSGLARVVEEQIGDQYVAGLWRSNLIEGMIWQAIGKTHAVPEYRAPSWSWASIDGPFGMFCLGVGPDIGEWTDQATIVDCQITLKGDNPYGEVTAGYLKIKGPLEPLFSAEEAKPGTGNLRRQKGEKLKTKSGSESGAACVFDTPTHAEISRDVPLWALVLTKGKQPSHKQRIYHAIVVRAVDGQEDTYRRIGKVPFTEDELGKCAWMEDETKKETINLV